MEIELSKGVVMLRKPLAGERNRAIMKAETPDGIKQTVMLVELLPLCIQSHPFGTAPLMKCLDELSIEEYDKLIDGLTKLLKPPEEGIQKN